MTRKTILSQRMQLVKPSPTLAMTAKAAALVAAGCDVINLSVGEPDFDTPNHVKDAGITAIREGKTKYTAVSGIQPLREVIAQKLLRDNKLHYDPKQVIVGSGAKQVIFNAFMSSLSANDEVVIPAPYWVSYVDMVLIAGGKPVIVDCTKEDKLKLTPTLLDNAITPNTKWLILNSPNNPTGVVYSEIELRQLADVLLLHRDVYVLSDDIYESIIFDGLKFVNIAQVESALYDRVLVVNGMSKSHSMTGWRIGYGAGPKELIQAMDVIQSQSTSNASSISQYAALAAYCNSQDDILANVKLFEKRRDIAISLLNETNKLRILKPGGAFYLFIDCSALFGTTYNKKDGVSVKGIMSGADFSEYLLEQYFVATVPGEGFGAQSYIRLSYAVDTMRLSDACKRIVMACNNLQ